MVNRVMHLGVSWGGGADAAATTAFLARTSGLSGTETAAYMALINGMVTDGTWALMDARLYIRDQHHDDRKSKSGVDKASA